MATIKFSNGQSVDFNGQPTQQDVEEIATKLGIHSVAPAAAPPKSFLDKATDIATSIFPGTKKIGESLGTAAIAAKEALRGHLDVADNIAKTNVPIPELAGAYAENAAAVAAPEVGGETVAGRIAASAAVNAATSGAGAVANGEDAGGVAKSALEGGALGAVFQGGGEALNKAFALLPTRLVRSILPKLEPGTEGQALENTRLGSISTLAQDSRAAVSNLGTQIHTILSHPDYAEHIGEGPAGFSATLDAFPHSNYTPDSIVSEVKGLVPEVGALVDKIKGGTATLIEKNTVRQALDKATASTYTTLNRPPESKSIGRAFAGALRTEVKNAAPETVPVFAKLSQEMNLRKALNAAQKKLESRPYVGLLDILSAMSGGLPGVAGEKFARSPAVGLATAKAASKVAKVLPTLNKVARGVRTPLINAAVNSQN